MKKTNKKLSIRSETVRALNNEQLSGIAGGVPYSDNITCYCQTFNAQCPSMVTSCPTAATCPSYGFTCPAYGCTQQTFTGC